MTIEKKLRLTLKQMGLRSIGCNIFEGRGDRVTVYLHYGDGLCVSATEETFDKAVSSAAKKMTI